MHARFAGSSYCGERSYGFETRMHARFGCHFEDAFVTVAPTKGLTGKNVAVRRAEFLRVRILNNKVDAVSR